MAGSQFRGGPTSARDRVVKRDDAITAEPHLLDAWKQAEQDWYDQPGNAEKAMQGSTEGWEHADKVLDQMIQSRSDAMSKAKAEHMDAMSKQRAAKKTGKTRAQRRYPSAEEE